ncbi:MAG: hypothetical protein ACI9W6_002899 [Motiliproteus sp.]|jgi:uncharacterized protein (DUF58 family)
MTLHKNASLQQFEQRRLEGAYPDLQQLIGLHRSCQQLKLSSLGRLRHSAAGERQTRRRGRGMEFEEVRPYQPGDDIRSIDWRVTARTQTPHTKLYREEQERPVLLAADLRSSMFFGSQTCFKSVLCANLMSALGWITLANRDRIGGIIFGDQSHCELRPKRSKHRVLEWIRQLQQFAQQLDSPCPEQPPQPLYSLLQKLLPICRPGSGLYIASDFHDLDERCYRLLYQLSRHADLTLFVLYDPLERQLPATEGLWVTDGQHRQPLSTALTQQTLIEDRLEALQHRCQPLGVRVLSLGTDEPLLARLNTFYGSRKSNGARP